MLRFYVYEGIKEKNLCDFNVVLFVIFNDCLYIFLNNRFYVCIWNINC